MLEKINFRIREMGAETIQKSAARPKSLMIRGNAYRLWLMTVGLLLLLPSCGSLKSSKSSKPNYSAVYRLSQYCAKINGVWGSWIETQPSKGRDGGYLAAYGAIIEPSFGVKVQYTSQIMDVFIYKITKFDVSQSNNHPSKYILKFTIDKATAKPVENGVIFSGRASFYDENLLTKDLGHAYSLGDILWHSRLGTYMYNSTYGGDERAKSESDIPQYDIPVTFWCDQDMKKAIENNGLYGTINIHYFNDTATGLFFSN